MNTRKTQMKQYEDAVRLHWRLQTDPEELWQKRGAERALKQFHAMAERVPAYKDFLKSRAFLPSQVRSCDDFHRIPPIDKDNYLRKYPVDMLCWDGEFAHGQWVISTTSGSTGQPYYFPRKHLQDNQYAMTAELYMRSNFRIHERTTLYIVAFPMGAWIGGLFTYEALKIVADRGGYNLSIITPGIHKQEVINAVKQLGGSFDQIIIGAYAPFLKDILDDGERAGIDWKELQVGFVFSAEAFSEKFRDYVLHKTGARDVLTQTLNHYGTVDMGTMAHETPESIMIRRTLVAQHELELIFPEKDRQPTFAQYNPEQFYFEAVENSLFCTADSGLPLVRYDLKDYGGVVSRETAHKTLAQKGYNVTQMAAEQGIADTQWNLPYVYIYERNDFSVSYYAFQLYPDMVRRALQHDDLIHKLTGKFTMQVDYNDAGRQELSIHVELKHGIEPSDVLREETLQFVQEGLVKESSEYRETYKMIGPDAMPIIYLWNYEDPTYFRPGTKQKWVVKDVKA
ncbi:phenylacetate--CoA ligase family protein [Candidatus Saccharibacteria bacterium]|nr:MAG: phenylacetate--CoA ligase family protein [Candidatus Saccharibacteria bacterium]